MRVFLQIANSMEQNVRCMSYSKESKIGTNWSENNYQK